MRRGSFEGQSATARFGDRRSLLAALLDVRLDELFRVLFEDGIDLVEELVQLPLELVASTPCSTDSSAVASALARWWLLCCSRIRSIDSVLSPQHIGIEHGRLDGTG
jgi:hypothetical protein